MIFNSFNFLTFFIVVVALYFSIPHRLRWVLLLCSSCFFYMYFIPAYILVIWSTIIIDYLLGIAIEKNEGNSKKRYLVVSIFANLSILGFFKYYNFLNQNIGML